MALDVITIGRSSVDLYGIQVGGLLEDMSSFRKSLGGSPANTAYGAARLGLKAALITRVGDEHLGRFIRDELAAAGVDTRGVKTDEERLTALAILGIRDQETFPLIFYRTDCADMAVCEDDIDQDFIAEAKCVTVSGTHLSHPRTRSAVMKALRLAREKGIRTALDIDYRPNLWGLAGHSKGESRFIASDKVTASIQETLGFFDLIVGTEEEFHIAGGNSETIAALAKVRELAQDAVLVCKRGPLGANAFTGEIGVTLDDGIAGRSFAIEVFNVLGAGDGFMAGLLRGWLRDESWEQSLTYANACGALAVSRHGCAPSYPSWKELSFFLERGVVEPALRNDALLEQIHWATNRRREWPELRIFAFDHRSQFESIAAKAGAAPEKIGEFKKLCLNSLLEVADGKQGFGLLCDSRLGQDALFAAGGRSLWIGRPVELPSSRPLELEIGPDYGSALAEWPLEHVVKVLCFLHPDDDEVMRDKQEETLIRLADAARKNNLDLLVELIPSNVASCDDNTTAALMLRLYEIGIKPDWWKLEPTASEAAWEKICSAVESSDPYCRGIVVLGKEAKPEELGKSFATAAAFKQVKGFAVGRTIFAEPAESWFAGKIDDGHAVAQMSANFNNLIDLWEQVKS